MTTATKCDRCGVKSYYEQGLKLSNRPDVIESWVYHFPTICEKCLDKYCDRINGRTAY